MRETLGRHLLSTRESLLLFVFLQNLVHAVGSLLVVCVVCSRFMRKWPQVAENEQSLSADDGDEHISHGSANSSEERMESTRLALASTVEGDIGTLYAAIATFARGQDIVVEKLTLLEKVVGTVQFDMTWVRDDIKAMHQAMETIVEQVSDIREGAEEVDISREEVALDVSPQQPWKGKMHVPNIEKPPSASTSRGETHCAYTDMHGSNAVRDDIGNEETEEQPQMLTTNAHFNRMPTAYEGKRDWDTGHQTSPAMCPTQCTQPRVSIDMQPLQEESQMFEMSFQSTDLPAPVVERSMWHDFTAAVRD